MVRVLKLLVLIAVCLLPVIGYAQNGVQEPEVTVMPYDGHTFGVYSMEIEAKNIRCDKPVTHFASSASGNNTAPRDCIGFWVTNPYSSYKLISVYYEPTGNITRDDGTFYAMTPINDADYVTIYGLQQTGSAVEPLGYNIPPHSQAYIPFSFIVPGEYSYPERWAFSIAVREITTNTARVGFNPTVYVDMWQPLPWYSNTMLLIFLVVIAGAILLVSILILQKVGNR